MTKKPPRRTAPIITLTADVFNDADGEPATVALSIDGEPACLVPLTDPGDEGEQ